MKYSEYLSETMNKNDYIQYVEYCAENVSNNVQYSEYLAEYNLDNAIAYSEYICENINCNLSGYKKEQLKKQRIAKLNKLNNLKD